MSFNKFYTEELLLTEDGKELLNPLKNSLEKLFSSKEISSMSESEKRIFCDSVANLVGTFLSNVRQTHKNENPFFLMSDDQFKEYLQNKYGPNYILKSLTKEEFDRVPVLSEVEIKASLEKDYSISHHQIKTKTILFPCK